MKIMPILEDEFDSYRAKMSPELTWVYNDTNYPYKIYDEEENIVGLIAFGEEYNELIDMDVFIIHIDNLDIFFKGRGYGTKVVNLLKNKYKRVEMYTLPSSVGFWIKNEFEAVKDRTGYYVWGA